MFCIVGTVFLCGAYVQSQRGHIGIEAMAGILPPRSTASGRYWSTCLSLAVLRIFRVEVVDAVARGVGRQDDDLVDLGSAAWPFPTG